MEGERVIISVKSLSKNSKEIVYKYIKPFNINQEIKERIDNKGI